MRFVYWMRNLSHRIADKKQRYCFFCGIMARGYLFTSHFVARAFIIIGGACLSTQISIRFEYDSLYNDLRTLQNRTKRRDFSSLLHIHMLCVLLERTIHDIALKTERDYIQYHSIQCIQSVYDTQFVPT